MPRRYDVHSVDLDIHLSEVVTKYKLNVLAGAQIFQEIAKPTAKATQQLSL